LRKYTKFKKANLNHHFKTNSIILANKKIQNYYNKLINTYVRNYPKYKIWKLKKFFFRREIEYVDLYDSIQRIRKKLKRKSIKTIAKNLRLGQQVFFSHAVPDYSSHKYNSYKNYKSLLPKKKLKYRTKKRKIKRVKRKYLKKYFKKKIKK